MKRTIALILACLMLAGAIAAPTAAYAKGGGHGHGGHAKGK